MNLWAVVPGIVVVALVFVLWPVAAAARSYWRPRRSLRCPDTGTQEGVILERAGLAEAFGKPSLRRVRHCTRWPAHRACGEECRTAERGVIIPLRRAV